MNAKNSIKPRFSTDGVTLNANGNNAALAMRPLDDAAMRELGFTDHMPDHWYLCRTVSADGAVTLNVVVGKEDGAWRVDVLDEWSGQPYDYQALLGDDPGHGYANMVAGRCEWWLAVLSEAGVLDGWTPGTYV